MTAPCPDCTGPKPWTAGPFPDVEPCEQCGGTGEVTAPYGSSERPGEWVEGIGWVARSGTLRPGDENIAAWPNRPGEIGTDFDQLVQVIRWADGTTPEPAPSTTAGRPDTAGLRRTADYLDAQGSGPAPATARIRHAADWIDATASPAPSGEGEGVPSYGPRGEEMVECPRCDGVGCEDCTDALVPEYKCRRCSGDGDCPECCGEGCGGTCDGTCLDCDGTGEWHPPLPEHLPKAIVCGECGSITATQAHVARLARFIQRNNPPHRTPGSDT